MNENDGLRKVRAAVADCLALSEDDVAPGSRLIAELGADSLDFVDLIFTLEKGFGVKLREGEFDFLSKLDVTTQDSVQGGFLTPDAVTTLAGWLPALKDAEDPARVTPQHLFSLITVETLWIMVKRKLAGTKTAS